jgi:hypothetical protein
MVPRTSIGTPGCGSARLHAHRADLGAARRLDQGAGIGRIGLVALHIRAHIGRGQQAHLDAQPIEPARPVVGRAASFHDHQADAAVDEPALELGAGEAVLFDHAPGGIGHGELEDGLGQIDAHDGSRGGDSGSSIHDGLRLFMRLLTPHTT